MQLQKEEKKEKWINTERYGFLIDGQSHSPSRSWNTLGDGEKKERTFFKRFQNINWTKLEGQMHQSLLTVGRRNSQYNCRSVTNAKVLLKKSSALCSDGSTSSCATAPSFLVTDCLWVAACL